VEKKSTLPASQCGAYSAWSMWDFRASQWRRLMPVRVSRPNPPPSSIAGVQSRRCKQSVASQWWKWVVVFHSSSLSWENHNIPFFVVLHQRWLVVRRSFPQDYMLTTADEMLIHITLQSLRLNSCYHGRKRFILIYSTLVINTRDLHHMPTWCGLQSSSTKPHHEHKWIASRSAFRPLNLMIY